MGDTDSGMEVQVGGQIDEIKRQYEGKDMAECFALLHIKFNSTVDNIKEEVKDLKSKVASLESFTENVNDTIRDVQERIVPNIEEAVQESTKVIFVKGPNCIFSNFYPCNILYENETFKSTEHVYQYKKANFHQHFQLAAEIKSADSAKSAKSLSKRIGKSNISKLWQDNKLAIMEDILETKFQQVEQFKSSLLDTGSSEIVHNVSHYYWGNGKNGAGGNNFGKLLMCIREKHS